MARQVCRGRSAGGMPWTWNRPLARRHHRWLRLPGMMLEGEHRDAGDGRNVPVPVQWQRVTANRRISPCGTPGPSAGRLLDADQASRERLVDDLDEGLPTLPRHEIDGIPIKYLLPCRARSSSLKYQVYWFCTFAGSIERAARAVVERGPQAPISGVAISFRIPVARPSCFVSAVTPYPPERAACGSYCRHPRPSPGNS